MVPAHPKFGSAHFWHYVWVGNLSVCISFVGLWDSSLHTMCTNRDALPSTDVSNLLSVHLRIRKVMCSAFYYKLISLDTSKATNEKASPATWGFLLLFHWCSEMINGNTLKTLCLKLKLLDSDKFGQFCTTACSLTPTCNHIENVHDRITYPSVLSLWIFLLRSFTSQGQSSVRHWGEIRNVLQELILLERRQKKKLWHVIS